MNLGLKEVDLDNDGYCNDCTNFHNCASCTRMDEFYSSNTISLVGNKTNLKIKKIITSDTRPLCGRCSKPMKFGKGNMYHCYDCEFSSRINR